MKYKVPLVEHTIGKKKKEKKAGGVQYPLATHIHRQRHCKSIIRNVMSSGKKIAVDDKFLFLSFFLSAGTTTTTSVGCWPK